MRIVLKGDWLNLSCARVFNISQQVSNFKILPLFCKYNIGHSNTVYVIAFKKYIPQVNSTTKYDNIGICRPRLFGWKHKHCCDVFQSQHAFYV